MLSNMGMIEWMILLIPVLVIVFLVFGSRRRAEAQRLGQDEAAQLSRLVGTLEKMEARIANLETILAARDEPRKERNTH